MPDDTIILSDEVETWPDIPDRNASCICGSGRKYKKCCLIALEAEEVAYAQDPYTVRTEEGKIEVLEIPEYQPGN